MQVGARGSFTRGGPFQRDFRKSMFHDGRLYAQWMERCEEFGIDVRTVCLSVCLRLFVCCSIYQSPSRERSQEYRKGVSKCVRKCDIFKITLIFITLAQNCALFPE